MKQSAQLSLAEIASTMDIPQQRVSSDLAAAEFLVDQSADFQLDQALEDLELQAPDSERIQASWC